MLYFTDKNIMILFLGFVKKKKKFLLESGKYIM